MSSRPTRSSSSCRASCRSGLSMFEVREGQARRAGAQRAPRANGCRTRQDGSRQGRAQTPILRCVRRTSVQLVRPGRRRPRPMSVPQRRMGQCPRSGPRRGCRRCNRPDSPGPEPRWQPRAPDTRRHGSTGSPGCPAQPGTHRPVHRRRAPAGRPRPSPSQRPDACQPRPGPRPQRRTLPDRLAPPGLRSDHAEESTRLRRRRPPQRVPHRGRRLPSPPQTVLHRKCQGPRTRPGREAPPGRQYRAQSRSGSVPWTVSNRRNRACSPPRAAHPPLWPARAPTDPGSATRVCRDASPPDALGDRRRPSTPMSGRPATHSLRHDPLHP
jgi:hypothetical protein